MRSHEYAYPSVHELTEDDPIARRAVAIVVEQGVNSFEALRIAEREANDLAYDVFGEESI